MLRGLSVGLLASAVAIAPMPLKAQDGSAEDLGDVMSISLKDVVKPTIGFQGALQGAGTPNQAGIGGFLPLSVGDNSVWFLDALANVNFADREGYSSIINTDVAGATISTSTRLGYRWLNGDRSWMYGLNAGYDTRPMATGAADSGVSLFGTEKSVFFQQAAVSLEAVSNTWNFNAYGLIPTGDKEQRINFWYLAGSLATYGIDAGYNITPDLTASIGYYYQDGDGSEADGSGVLGRVAYEITNGLIAGVNISYDEAFEARVSADVEYRFGGPNKTIDKKKVAEMPVIKALSSSPNHRNVRVHDKLSPLLPATEVLPWLEMCAFMTDDAREVTEDPANNPLKKFVDRDIDGQFGPADDRAPNSIVQHSNTSSTFSVIQARKDPNFGKVIFICSYNSKSNKGTYALYKDKRGNDQESVPRQFDDSDRIVNISLTRERMATISRQSENILGWGIPDAQLQLGEYYRKNTVIVDGY